MSESKSHADLYVEAMRAANTIADRLEIAIEAVQIGALTPEQARDLIKEHDAFTQDLAREQLARLGESTALDQSRLMAMPLPPGTALREYRDRLRVDVRPSIRHPDLRRDLFDVEYDSVDLRWLLERDRNLRREEGGWHGKFTPAQRAEISSYWSAELRAKVADATAADRDRERTRVVLDCAEDL